MNNYFQNQELESKLNGILVKMYIALEIASSLSNCLAIL